MEAPEMVDFDEEFKLDSEVNGNVVESVSDLTEKGKALSRKHILRMVRKEKKMASFFGIVEKPLIWNYLVRRNSNAFRNFHN